MLFKNFGVPINAQRAKSGLHIWTYQRAKRQYIKDIRALWHETVFMLPKGEGNIVRTTGHITERKAF